ncbi:MAG: phosphate ABC transporter permease subunit PstC [Luteolibacter sp.]
MTSTATWQKRRLPDATTLACAATVAIFLSLLGLALILWLREAWPAISTHGTEMLATGEWFYRHERFGALAMIYGSAVVSLIALALAAPIAFATAIFISEWLPHTVRPWAKAAVEFLAAVPSVIYGLLGIMFLRTWMVDWLAPFDPFSGDMLLTAAVLLAVMILPTVTTFAEDALRAVPAAQRLAARGLALNRAQTIHRIVLPQAWPGMIGAALLGLGRAIGETIAVFLVIGRLDNRLPESLLDFAPLIEPGQTLTSKLGGPETHIAMGDPLHWGAILTLGLILLVLTTLFVSLGNLLLRKNPAHP